MARPIFPEKPPFYRVQQAAGRFEFRMAAAILKYQGPRPGGVLADL